MKLYTKVLSLLLALLMLAGFVACSNGSGDEKSKEDSMEESVSSEESSISDEERAAELYKAALDGLKEKTDIKQSITATVTRTVSKDVFAYETEIDVVRMDGKFYANEKTEADNKIYKNQKYFADGKYTYVTGDDCYYKEMEAEAAEEMLLPVILLDEELYESLAFDGDDESTLVLTGATAIEAWAAPDYATVKTAEGTIKLSDGEITAYEYTAEYTQNSVDYKLAYSVTLSAPEAKDEIKLPETEGIKLDSIELIDTLEMAYIATTRLTSFDFSFNLDTYSLPGAVGYMDQLTLYTYGKNKDDFLAKMNSSYMYISDGRTQSMTSESLYKDGKLTTTVDGKESTENMTMDEVIDYAKDYDEDTPLLKPDMTLFESFEIKDLGGHWYISYKLNEDGGKSWEDYVGELFYEDVDLVDGLASKYVTEKAEGFISIDKDALIISAAGIDFECVHTIEGEDYKSAVIASTSYAIGTVSTYKTITDELPEEEEPEEKAKPLFYKVTSTDGKTMYLLGTIHTGDSKTAYLPKEIYEALESSDALAVEINMPKYEEEILNDKNLHKEYFKLYYYDDETLIEDKIDKELYEAALPYILTTGTSTYYANRMTPYGWSDGIDRLNTEANYKLSSYYGVDRRLMKIAEDKGIKIYDIEDPKEHILLPNKYSDYIKELLLESSISVTRHEIIHDIDELYALWCEGDENAIKEHLLEEDLPEDATEEEIAAYEEYNKILLTDRDAIMIEKAKEYLESDETVFFAVGMAHVLSETGLVESLRADGYTVEIVEYAK